MTTELKPFAHHLQKDRRVKVNITTVSEVIVGARMRESFEVRFGKI